MANTTNIFRDGTLIDIDVSFWSGAKNLQAQDLGLEENEVADAYKLGKKMLVPEEVIRKFRTIEGRARALVENNSFKFPIGNARFIPKKKFSKILGILKTYNEDYMKLVDDLILRYEEYRLQMIPMYEQAAETAYINQLPVTATFGLEHDPVAEKKSFVEAFMARIKSYYPPVESLRSKFSLGWSVYEIAIPRMKQGDAEEIALDADIHQAAVQDYQTQIHDKIGGFVSEVVAVLRQETVDLCNKIASNITDGKVIRSTTVQSLRNFIDKFSDLNFVGDTQIEQQLESIRKELLDTHPTEAFSENTELQGELKRRLNLIVQSAAELSDINEVTGQYKRKIDWEL